MNQPIYQNLADRVVGLIRGGTFPAGSKLPSVRRMSREQRVSVTTVMEAYGRLLDLGVIEARARSGYYVAPPRVGGCRLPLPVPGPARPTVVRSSEIFGAVMDAVSDPAVVPFGCAVPGDELVPGKKLSSITNAVLRRHGPAAFQYTLPPGRRELRAAISRRLLAAGVDAPPEAILTTQGATEAMYLALRSTTRPGDLVAVESPTYFGILQLLKQLRLKVVEIPMDPVHGIDTARLEQIAAKHRIKACIVQPSFQNPLGSCMPDESKATLVALAELHDFVVVESDLYSELAHSGKRPLALSHFDRHDRVMHCSSVLKTVAPGLRVGWLLPGRRMKKAHELKLIHFPANPTLSELVAAEYFETGGVERHLTRCRARHAEQCRAVREAILAAFPAGTRVNEPGGGFVLWVEMPDGFDSEEFAVRAFAKGISLVPGPLFSPSCGMRNCFRVSCGALFDDRARKALALLGRMAAEMMS